MAEKSTLNDKLPKVTKIAFYTVQGGERNVEITSGYTGQIYRANGLSSVRIPFTKATTGNSDKFKLTVGFQQPSNRANPYQVQYRWHARWTPAMAKKKGASWTSWTAWKSFVAADGIAQNSTTHPDYWLKPNVGVNSGSAYVYMGDVTGTFASGGSLANYDKLSYCFRVRTYNVKTQKHGPWVYSESLHIIKAPRVANLTLYTDDEGGLVIACNIRYADRKGVFTFPDILDSNKRNVLKQKVTVSMITDTRRTVNSVPPKRDGFAPVSCRIPLSKLKRGISPGEYLYMSDACQFVANSDSGSASLVLNVSGAYTPIGNGAYKRLHVAARDVSINPVRLVVKRATAKNFIEAWLYRTDANDLIESAAATMTYKYNGKTYTVKPHYTDLKLSTISTRQYIAYWIFVKCPLGIKLTVKGSVSNSLGSARSASNAITLPSEFWYIQKESSPSIGAVLQWNAKIRSRTSPPYTMELPYGRGKPFIAYGTGLSKTFDVSGEVPTQTQDPIFNKTLATKAAWTKVQNNPGIYIIRGPEGVMYRMAITEVSLEQDDKTEILKVSFSGTEIE